MNKIPVYYYEDSFGKIIRFNFDSIEQLIYYKKMIDEMVNGKIEQIYFNDLDNFDMLNKIKVKLKHNKYSFIDKQKKEVNTFIIYQDKENLITHSYLIDPFIEKNLSGHQYIEFDNYIVMLSFKEN